MATIPTAKLNIYLNKYKEIICASDSNRIPRFGPYSIHAKATPMFVFESEALAERCDTAFTDGTNIYFYADFFEEMLRQQKEHNSNDVEWVIMHELAHMLYQHNKRMREFPHEIRNIAADLSINTRLQRDFEQLKVSPFLKNTVLGFKPGDVDHYVNMFEEDIARELLTKDAEELKKMMEELEGMDGDGDDDDNDQGSGGGQEGKSGKGGKRKPGKGKDGQGDNQDNDQGDDQGQGGGQGDEKDQEGDGGEGDKKGKKGKKKKRGMGHDHIVDPQSIRETLEKAGLGHIADTMNLPRNKGESDKFNKKQQQRVIDTVNQSKQANMRAGGRLPGAHSLQYASEIVDDLSAPKMKWKGAISDVIYGAGMNYKYTDDVPGSIYYYEPSLMGFSEPVFVGETIPAKSDTCTLVFVDTSGSVNDEELREFYSETIGILDNDEMTGEVIIMSADSAMRGEPLVINTDNYETFRKGVPFHGRGGTDFVNSINGGMKWADDNDKKINAIIYFTDLGDTPPKRDQLPENLPRMLYVTTKNNYTEAYRKAVSDYADTVYIEVGKEIDLEELEDNDQTASMGM